MSSLDFVVSHPAAPKLNALPIAARTVTLDVPDTLDPYHHQQLRDALKDEFRSECGTLAKRVAAAASIEEQSNNRLLDEFAAGLAELQSALEQSAARWLVKWSPTIQPAVPQSGDHRAVIFAAEQERYAVLALVEQARGMCSEPNLNDASATQLKQDLNAQLGRLSARLEVILGLPANGMDDASREALVQQMIETIQAGDAAAKGLLRTEE